MLNSRFHFSGIVITAFTSFLIIFILFFEVFKEPNKILFAPWGDGMQNTYCCIYHIENDTTYWMSEAMNYPFQESVFFTGNQLPLTNIIKALKGTRMDISDYTIGIINILLLLSFVIGSVFLYLVFRKLKLPVWISVLGALLIIFLSPQWDRLNGHYNLVFGYAFPIGIYLIMLFYEKPGFKLSAIISLYLFFLCWKHLYFLVLVGILILFVFTYLFIKEHHRFGGRYKLLLHLFIQLILPFLIFSVFTSFFDHSIDRTAYPWGFIHFTTRVETVFLPLMKPYGNFIHIRGSLKTVAYVGLVSTLIFTYINIRLLIRAGTKGFNNIFQITDNKTLNLLYWAGFISFLISLGLPFSLGLEKLVNYTGPFRQFRAIGRFIFPFYYMLNILSIFILFSWFRETSKKWIKIGVILALGWFTYDAYLNMKVNSKKYINKVPVLYDWGNETPINQWVNKHDWNDYQAIMPIPYFHIGTENYWVSGVMKNHKDAFVTSLKTKLPLNSVSLSRTPIKQSLKNIDLILDPDDYQILDELPNKKPYLLMLSKDMNISSNEARIVSKGIYLDENEDFVLYTLPLDSLRKNVVDYRKELAERAKAILQSDTIPTPIFYSGFNEMPEGKFVGDIRKKHFFHEEVFKDTGWYTFSFYSDQIDKDLWPRTRIFVHYCDYQRNCPNSNFNFSERIVKRNDGIGLYEDDLFIGSFDQLMQFAFYNSVATKGNFTVDDLLIRRKGEDILQLRGGKYFLNNREVHGLDPAPGTQSPD